jgi:hypothetical protein
MPSQSRRRLTRRSVPQQIDLFAENALVTAIAPTWSRLPLETQATLTSLMTRLILDHADKRRIASMGDGHDL